ncbi:hypothetical protein MNBD_PLANCTO02-1593 [hydrothermal vent metagenome]|uniref:Thioredoxin domain-containing protein n=1 Tax=hydrothermal vent metagenome TaxID=652676 RepID=A0A3B1DUW5_9ZZZZ
MLIKLPCKKMVEMDVCLHHSNKAHLSTGILLQTTNRVSKSKWWQRAIPVLCCLIVVLSLSKVEGASQRWHSDLNRAMAEAKKLNKPLIIHFYADWCGPCKKMDRDVLYSRGLLRQFGTRFVGVKINSDHNQQLADRLGIRALPSDVFVHPEGWVIKKSSGSKNLRGYFSQLAQIESKFKRIEQFKLARGKKRRQTGPRLIPFDDPRKKKSQANKGFDTLKLQTKKQATIASTKKQGRIVGLSAFSPVTLKDQRKWIRGSRQFSETHEGITYYMRSQREVQRFKAAPERYVPRYLGCDAVILKEYQKAIPGSTRFAAFYKEQLFLFTKPVSRKEFKKQPSAYSKIKNNITLDSIRH